MRKVPVSIFKYDTYDVGIYVMAVFYTIHKEYNKADKRAEMFTKYLRHNYHVNKAQKMIGSYDSGKNIRLHI